jgi:citrate synthase
MTTFVGTAEAARRLGVTSATLYAYVSRGRISRRSAADGRTSLFALDDVEALAQKSRRGPREPRPSIDVRITSAVTSLGEDGIRFRGHDLAELVRLHSFEAIAELLWSGELEPTTWPACREPGLVDSVADVEPIARLAIAAYVLGDRHPGDDAPTAARRLLSCAPSVLGARRATGSIAHRLASVWVRTPSKEMVSAIDTAIGVLADHELAASTLAVRVAASVRSPPAAAFAAGLAVVAGPLHGRASQDAHEFLHACEANGVAATVASHLASRRKIPGFGHKVYRTRDPRFDLLIETIRPLGDLTLLDDVLAEVGRTVPKHPNVDLALGALTWRLGLDQRVPLFAVARIAGWAAHYAEEIEAPPVRFRGITA